MQHDEWLSTGPASRLLGVSQQWVRHLAKTGQLAYAETGFGFIVKRSDVEELARRRAENPTHHALRSAVA